MMTPAAVGSAAQAATYYQKYYTEGPGLEARGSWWGKGAEALGLTGQPTEEQFFKLLEGRLPNGSVMPTGKGDKRELAYDLTFSAPKSVSIATFLGRDTRIAEVHEQAVTKALEFLEREAAMVRVKTQGWIHREWTGNLVVARFQDHDSRLHDPQLHTHAVVLNITQRADGQWRAIGDQQAWYRLQYAASAIYRAELAAGLQGLKYRIERTHADGRFEIKGFDRQQHLEPFSRRRRQVEQRAIELQEKYPEAGNAKIQEIAARDTRAKKQHRSVADLMPEWQARAEQLGVDKVLADLRVTARSRKVVIPFPTPEKREAAARQSLSWALEHLTERQSVFEARYLIQHAAQRATGQVAMADIEHALTAIAQDGILITLRSGSDALYTTKDALAREYRTLDLARSGRELYAEAPLDPAQAIGRVLVWRDRETGIDLNEEQQRAAELALSSRDLAVGIQGYAGVGKTTLMRAVRELAAARGYEVKGFAPSAAAARVLEDEAGIKSATVDKFVRSQKRLPSKSQEKQLWIVDEASMLGTKDAQDLLELAKRQEARLVFVGDREQLPSIEAGKPFALLCDRAIRVATVSEIQRQSPDRAPAELREQVGRYRDAVEQTIAHCTEGAIATLQTDLREVADHEERLQKVAEDYLRRKPAERQETLVMVQANADARELNEIIRTGLRQEGTLSGPAVPVAVLINKRLTQAQARDALNYDVGEVVRFGRSYQRLGVQTGEYLTVVGRDDAGNTVKLRAADGREVDWLPHRAIRVESYSIEARDIQSGDLIRWTRNDYSQDRRNGELARVVALDPETRTATVLYHGNEQTLCLNRERHWDHGYAATVHAAQGRTAERVIAHLDTSRRSLTGFESWYVAISRVKRELVIYTDHAEALPQAIQRSMAQRSAIEEREKTVQAKDQSIGQRIVPKMPEIGLVPSIETVSSDLERVPEIQRPSVLPEELHAFLRARTGEIRSEAMRIVQETAPREDDIMRLRERLQDLYAHLEQAPIDPQLRAEKLEFLTGWGNKLLERVQTPASERRTRATDETISPPVPDSRASEPPAAATKKDSTGPVRYVVSELIRNAETIEAQLSATRATVETVKEEALVNLEQYIARPWQPPTLEEIRAQRLPGDDEVELARQIKKYAERYVPRYQYERYTDATPETVRAAIVWRAEVEVARLHVQLVELQASRSFWRFGRQSKEEKALVVELGRAIEKRELAYQKAAEVGEAYLASTLCLKSEVVEAEARLRGIEDQGGRLARIRTDLGRLESLGIRELDVRRSVPGQEPSWQDIERAVRAKASVQREITRPAVRPLSAYYRDPAYGGDLQKAEIAWSRDAHGAGRTRHEIIQTVLAGRDLSEKGNQEQQLSYVNRAVDMAIRSAENERIQHLEERKKALELGDYAKAKAPAVPEKDKSPPAPRRQKAETSAQARSPGPSRGSYPIPPLQDFHRNPIYDGDLDRADLDWALHAAQRGMSEREIAKEISRGRNLKEKGSESQQREYAERTAKKATEIESRKRSYGLSR